MKRTIYIIVILITLLSCNRESDLKESRFINNSDNLKLNGSEFDDNISFELAMHELILKYPFLDISPYDSLPYSNNYYLTKRVYYPLVPHRGSDYYNNLTLEHRVYESCGGCWEDEIIFIYNDSINYIIPLHDYYYYWRMSSDAPVSIEEQEAFQFTFEYELNCFLKMAKATNWFDANCLIHIIMTDMLGYFPVFEFDIPKLEAIANYTIESDWYNEDCKSQIMKNISFIKGEIKDGNRHIYSDGTIIFLIKIVMNDDIFSHVEIETLNQSCHFRLII